MLLAMNALEVVMKATVAVVAATTLIACAQTAGGSDREALVAEPESRYSLTWRDDGALVLDAEVLVPNGCYYADGAAGIGIPPGIPPVAHTLSVILPLAARDGVCTMALEWVKFNAVFEQIPVDTVAVITYELWPSGEPVRPQALALPLQ